MDQLPCPDGYLLDMKSAIADGHHALNQYLVRVEEAGWSAAIKEVNGIRDKQRKLLVWKALIERILYLRDNNPQSAFVSPYRGLAERIEKWTLAPTEVDLIEILERTADAANFLPPFTPMQHLIAYIDTHGLTADLAAAIRSFRNRMDAGCFVPNQVSLQLFRSRLDMLSWRDEWTPVDLKRCWSEQIRADFRAMDGAERENWRRLLYSIHGDESTRPAPKWLKEALANVKDITPESFRNRLTVWFAPLRKGASQRLSREGSFLLRSLLWLAQASNDPELIARIPEIAEVEFKPKTNGQKVIRAVADITGMPDPTMRPPAAAPRLEDLVTRALSVALSSGNSVTPSPLSGRVEVGEGVIYVRGKLDRYEVHVAGGTIIRQSDGQRMISLATTPRPLVMPLPGAAEVMDLLRKVMILAQDDTYSGCLTTAAED